MSETMLTYSLSNGTHLLIHHNVLDEKDSDGLPLLVLEDDAAVSNIAAGDECNSIVLPNMHIVNTATVGDRLEQLIEDDQPNKQVAEENKHEEEKRSAVDALGSFAEMVTWYKCKKCDFAAAQVSELLEHLKKHNSAVRAKPDTSHLTCKSSKSKGFEEEETEAKNTSPGCTLSGYTNSESTSNGVGETSTGANERFVFLCGQCAKGYDSLEICKQHMMQDHDLIIQEDIDSAHQDNYEGESQDSNREEIGNDDIQAKVQAKELLQSIRESQPVCNLPCSRVGCPLKFSNCEALEIHLHCHIPEARGMTEQQFRCNNCGEMFSRWRSCAAHLWASHGQDVGLLTCPVCGQYRTAVAARMVAHVRTHGEARSFCCPDCGKGFKQAAQLRNHRVLHMDRKADNLPRWYASKRCDICFKTYADSKCLKKHIQAVHSKLRPYVCHVCGHASARRAMLQMHLRQHTGEKPHSCPACPYRTGDHNSLRRHIMRHTGQRPYRCPHCPYTAIQSSPYKNHLRSKHPGQSGIFCCVNCPYKTVSREGFVLHVNNHKNGLLPSVHSTDDEAGGEGSVEVFPGNVAAAQIIYRCLSAVPSDGSEMDTIDVTSSNTSADGNTQTITIEIPTQDSDEDETPNSLLEVVYRDDTGGITIPADQE